jgi:hypothetical protein
VSLLCDPPMAGPIFGLALSVPGGAPCHVTMSKIRISRCWIDARTDRESSRAGGLLRSYRYWDRGAVMSSIRCAFCIRRS